MMSGSGNPPMQGGSFNHLEFWFNDALDLLGVFKLKVERTLADDRSPTECISLRETLDQFSNGLNAFVRVERLKEDYEAAGFSQVLEEIKISSGDLIKDEKCQIHQNGKTFYTPAEALNSLLELICRERETLDYAVQDYDKSRADYLESFSPDGWDEHWYGIILFHVSELSSYGLNDDFLNQLRKLFDQQKYGYLKWKSEQSGGDGKGQISQNDMSIRHNPSSSLFDDLLAGFKEAEVQQQEYKISHVLTEFVSEDAIRRGWADQREKLEEWRAPIGLDNPKIKNPQGRCYHSAILLYQGEKQIQDLEILKKFAPVYDRLKRYLETAGADLLEKLDLPSEISIQTDPVSRWLLYLHYRLKPDRTTWEIGAGLNAFGMFLPGDRIDDAGEFSFEKLSENSYSIIGDVPLSSIRAVRGMQDQTFIEPIGIDDSQSETNNVQQTESFTFDQLAVKYAGYSNRNGFIKQSKPFGVTCDKDGPWTIPQAIELFEKILEKGSPSRHIKGKMQESVSNWRQKL